MVPEDFANSFGSSPEIIYEPRSFYFHLSYICVSFVSCSGLTALVTVSSVVTRLSDLNGKALRLALLHMLAMGWYFVLRYSLLNGRHFLFLVY